MNAFILAAFAVLSVSALAVQSAADEGKGPVAQEEMKEEMRRRMIKSPPTKRRGMKRGRSEKVQKARANEFFGEEAARIASTRNEKAEIGLELERGGPPGPRELTNPIHKLAQVGRDSLENEMAESGQELQRSPPNSIVLLNILRMLSGSGRESLENKMAETSQELQRSPLNSIALLNILRKVSGKGRDSLENEMAETGQELQRSPLNSIALLNILKKVSGKGRDSLENKMAESGQEQQRSPPNRPHLPRNWCGIRRNLCL